MLKLQNLLNYIKLTVLKNYTSQRAFNKRNIKIENFKAIHKIID